MWPLLGHQGGHVFLFSLGAILPSADNDGRGGCLSFAFSILTDEAFRATMEHYQGANAQKSKRSRLGYGHSLM